MVAQFFTWTLCFALFMGVCGYPTKMGNTHGQHQGGTFHHAVGNDASKKPGQLNPLGANEYVRYENSLNPSAAVDQVGSAGFAYHQMGYEPSKANANPTGHQQQGLGSSAQVFSSSGSNAGPFSHTGSAVYGSLPSHSSSALGVGHEVVGPVFKGGEYLQHHGAHDHGNYRSETEEEGAMQQPRHATFSSGGQTSRLRPGFGGFFPYYDYRFLLGQYPRGTYTHSSISHTYGQNHWNDAHYVRDSVPYGPSSGSLSQGSSDPAVHQHVETSRQQNPVASQGTGTRKQVPHQQHGHQGSYHVQTPGHLGHMGKV